MALTGHSHRPGKITATTHLPCPQGLPARVVLTPPSWSAVVAAGPAPARHRIGHYAPSQQSASLAVLSRLFGVVPMSGQRRL